MRHFTYNTSITDASCFIETEQILHQFGWHILEHLAYKYCFSGLPPSVYNQRSIKMIAELIVPLTIVSETATLVPQ